jgi:hypothetical protein
MTSGGEVQRLALVLAQRGSTLDGILRLQSTLAGGFRGTLDGERLRYTASLLGDCRAEYRGEASATAQEIRGTFAVTDCAGRAVRGAFRVTR